MDNTGQTGEGVEYDKVAQASLNGIYVKAQELDRGHNDEPAPAVLPPGATGVADAQAHASDKEAHASTHASDAESHASAHAGDAPSADAETGASR